jgi:hypothetical protein
LRCEIAWSFLPPSPPPRRCVPFVTIHLLKCNNEYDSCCLLIPASHCCLHSKELSVANVSGRAF